MRVSALGLGSALFASLYLATGCGRSWPAVRAVGDVDFLTRGGVRTVDVLPIDIGVDAAPDSRDPPAIIYERFSLIAGGEVSSQLARRGYFVTSFIDWSGNLMSRESLEATQASLASYGDAQEHADGVLLTPFLPARLGVTTGADATLYVGGWAYAGHDEGGVSAGDVAKVVLIALFIVVIVAVAVVAAKKGGGGGGGGGVARGAAQGAGSVATSVGRAGVVAVRGVGRAGHHLLRAMANGVDAWGRSNTHITVWNAPPAGPPPMTGPSRTMLEMTLLDNRRGVVLWHARQEFAANPGRPDDVREVVARMLAPLPPAQSR